MFGAALIIVFQAILVATMPEGPEKIGAMTVVGLAGMAFNFAAVVYVIRWVWRARDKIQILLKSE
jgi:hypothetical protein